MQKIEMGNIKKDIIIKKYTESKIKNRCKIIVPLGFFIAVLDQEGNIKFSHESRNEPFRKLTDIYFIRQRITEPEPWGTSNIQYIDQDSGLKRNMGANGNIFFYVKSPIKIVRQTANIGNKISVEDIIGLLKPKIDVIIKKLIPQHILGLNLEQTSQLIKESLCCVFDEYGLIIDNFSINRVVFYE